MYTPAWRSVNLALSTLLALSTAQYSSSSASSTTTSTLTPVSTGISGSYDGPLRPRVHFSPPQGFMNDPNGMFVDSSGLFHLYYQYNPSATVAGFQHWGHATSSDLYHWTNQAVALAPTNSSEGIFSGSCVVDTNNTSGFFPNQTNGVVAIYTLNTAQKQTQDIAYSRDGGYTFTKYEANPVLDINSPQFRDPKVFWYEDHWVMAISFVQEHKVGIYTSANLKEWELVSNFTSHGLLGAQWECPNLVPMPLEADDGTTTQMWLMYVSIQPGAPLGGSIGQYFPGSFNGTHFEAIDGVARIADWGKDNYATQFFDGVPWSQRQVSVAWASNWQYCNYQPSGPTEGWASAMSLPRANYLKEVERFGVVLVSLPYGIEAVRGEDPVAQSGGIGNETFFADLGGGSGAFVIGVNVTGLNTTGLSNTASVNFTVLSSVSGESVSGGQMFSGDGNFFLDRGNTLGLQENVFFTNRFSTANILGQSFDFMAVVDRSIVEVFVMEGQNSATLSLYPEYVLDTVMVKAKDLNADAQVSVQVWELEDAWAQGMNSSGIVPANGTQIVRRNLGW